MNGDRTAEKFRYRNNIFKDEDECEMYIFHVVAKETSATAIFSLLRQGVCVKILRCNCHMVCGTKVYNP